MATSPETLAHFLVQGTEFLFCCFSNWNVEPMLSGSFKEKADLGTEAIDHQQETV